MFCFSSLKLQYRRTMVLLNKLKLFKETSFSKARDDGHAISGQGKCGCPKTPRDFPPRKDGILHSRSSCLGTSLPRQPRRTLTSQPTFFRSIDYQISLAMELRRRALLILYAQLMSLLCSNSVTIMLHYNYHKNK